MNSFFQYKTTKAFCVVLLFSLAQIPMEILGLPNTWGALVLALSSLACIFGIWSFKQLLDSISKSSDVIKEWKNGNFDVRFANITDHTQIAEMKWDLNDLIDVIDAFMREIKGSMEAIRDDKYYRKILPKGLSGIFRMTAKRINETLAGSRDRHIKVVEAGSVLESNIKALIEQLVSVAHNLNQKTEDLVYVSKEALVNTDDAFVRSSNSSSIMKSLSDATQQLSEAIVEISSRTSESNAMTEQATHQASIVSSSVQNLKQSSNEIDEVIQLITNIATKTNLLALNATIEAARAGEEGKSFAVVASEVKNLAKQTVAAAEQITSQIDLIQGYISDTVDSIEGIIKSIVTMQQISTAVSAAVEEQSVTTSGLSQNMMSGSREISGINTNINQLTNIVEKAHSASTSVQGDVTELLESIESLRSDVGNFSQYLR